jgi:tRNA threonylcarbamoyladenosine biosynthesis protein TsaB
MAVELLQSAGIGWEGIDRIAVGTGPGTFTGLRIGIATARALARGRGIPLVGISTLQSLAAAALADPNASRVEVVLAVLDARRGEVFAAGWWEHEVAVSDDTAAQRALLPPRAYAPEMLAATVEQLRLPALAVGDGAVAFRTVLERSGTVIPEDDSELHRVSAASHCRLAYALRASVPDEVLPEYLRLPDAEIARRAARKP